MPAKLKPIYLAKSFAQLQDKLPKKLEGKPIKRLQESALTVYKQAEEYRKQGDEESSYIYFMRFADIVNHIAKNDRKSVTPLLPKFQNALNNAEQLASALQKRYDEVSKKRAPKIEAAVEPPARSPQPSSGKTLVEATQPAADAQNGTTGEEFIRSQTLHEWLTYRGGESGLLKTILIIDVRPSNDYEKSHVKSDFVINIPQEIIVEGKTANYYRSKLKPQFLPLWDQRKLVDRLVAVDWSSMHPYKDEPLKIFKYTIDNWDHDEQKYKSRLFVLDGGFELYGSTYPNSTTGPSHKTDTSASEMDESLNILDISFPSLSESPESSFLFSHIGNGGDPNTFGSGMRTNQMPPFPSSKPPSVDRTKKANAEQLYQKNKRDQFQLKIDIDRNTHKLDDVEDELSRTQTNELLEEKRKLQEEVSELKKLHLNKEEENERLHREIEEYKHKERVAAARQVPKPGILPTPSLVSAEEERDAITAPDERRHAPDIDGAHTIPSKLDEDESSLSDIKRSQSTPNIPQVPADDELTPPVYDRSTKPVKVPFPSPHLNASIRAGGLTGLKNLGNTCYMNAIIQCISHTSKLCEYFYYGKYRNDLNTSASNPTRGEVAEKLANVIRALWSGERSFISCEDLKRVVGRHSVTFAGTSQQDAHEFLTFLMDWLHNDLCRSPGKRPVNHELLSGPKMAWNEFKKASDSVISDLFFVQQVSTVECGKCSVKSITYEEPTSNLTLQLTSLNHCSLQDCLRLYTTGEPISGYKCESCEQTSEAMKKVDIWRLPQILVIHLKRFYSDGLYHKRQTRVEFPLSNLEMREFTSNIEARNTRYNLYAVCNHYGTLEGGHYKAYCKNRDRWYCFDDQDVREQKYVVEPNAYILFYELAC